MNTGLSELGSGPCTWFPACPVGAGRNDGSASRREAVHAAVLLKSLSARLLILTVFFVMVGEVLIFVPSVARYRMTYFENRLAAGYIATLALDASPTGHLEQGLVDKLLDRVGAQGVDVYRAGGSVLRLDRSDPPRPDFTIDLTHPNIWLAIRGSFRT